MGGGSFDSGKYSKAVHSRKLTGTRDFEYSHTATESTPVHPNLDPKRINKKPFGKLESRDSAEHPKSNAVLLCLDVTGSNITRAEDAQKKLPNLMGLLTKYLPDPQVAIAANDDYHSVGNKAFQIADFESDNRVDEHIRNILLTSQGGGNMGESYDLAMYAAANKTILDCYEKRGRKGYFFMYADEPIFTTTSPEHAKKVFGDDLPTSIPIEKTIKKLREQYHVFVLWPDGGYKEAYDQFLDLFGKDCVIKLQHPNLICEAIGALVGMTEGKLATAKEAAADMVAAGTPASEAALLSHLLWGDRKLDLGTSATA